MSGTQHPPSTTAARPTRRTITTTLCVLSLLALTLVAVERTGAAAASEPAGPTTTDRPTRTERDGRAVLDHLEAMARVVAPTIPPTPPPPPPPPPAPPTPQPVASGSGYNDPDNPAAWDRLAQCESSGNWAANTGNGYYGGIQFSLASWQGVGGSGRPDQASRSTQIAMAQRLWTQGGWGQWPGCSLKLGYR